MCKRIYISADYDEKSGDIDVVEQLIKWSDDNLHSLKFVDMAKVISGSITLNNDDCRPCQIKEEFN